MGVDARFRRTGLDRKAPPSNHLAALANALETGRLGAGYVRYPLYIVSISRGQPIRFVTRNRTIMPHPMRLHGHDFQPVLGSVLGARKDKILLAPRQETEVEWLAGNPGAWAFRCHNVYHAEAGVLRRVDVS